MPQKVAQKAFGDIADVRHTLFDVFVVERVKSLDVAAGDAVKAVFDVVAGLLVLVDDFLDEGPVFEHKQMRIKDLRFILAEFGGDFVAHAVDLRAGLHEGALEAAGLLLLALALDLVDGDFELFLQEDKGHPVGHAR